MKIRTIILLSACSLNACGIFNDNSNTVENISKKNMAVVSEKKNPNHSNFIVLDNSYIVDVENNDFVLGEDLWPKNKISIVTKVPIGIKRAMSYVFDSLDYNIRYVDIINGSDNFPFIEKNISFTGDIKSYIKFIEYTFDVNITSESNDLVVSFYEQKHYKVSIFSNSFKSSGGFSVGGGGDSGTNPVNLANTYDNSGDFWQAFEPYIRRIVTDGHYLMMPQLATLVVVTRPSIQKTLGELINAADDTSTGQVIINYKIYEIDKERLSSLAAELNVNYTDGSFNALSQIATIVGGKGQGIATLTQEEGTLGLQAVLEKTSSNIVSEGEINTLTNRVVPLNITRETAYVSSVERQVGGEGQQSFTAVTPETINTGMSLMFLPRIMPNNKVQLETGFSRSTLSTIENFEGLVQLPIVDRSEGITTNLLKENTPTLVQLFEEERHSNFNRTGMFGLTHNPQVKSKLLAVIVNVRVDRR